MKKLIRDEGGQLLARGGVNFRDIRLEKKGVEGGGRFFRGKLLGLAEGFDQFVFSCRWNDWVGDVEGDGVVGAFRLGERFLGGVDPSLCLLAVAGFDGVPFILNETQGEEAEDENRSKKEQGDGKAAQHLSLLSGMGEGFFGPGQVASEKDWVSEAMPSFLFLGGLRLLRKDRCGSAFGRGRGKCVSNSLGCLAVP